MDALTKKIGPGFQSNSDISTWVKSLDDETRLFIRKAAKTMEQLNYLKWGTSSHEEVLNEIRNIQKSK